MRTNANMTIYNMHRSSGGEIYQRTVVKRVEWQNTKGSNVRATGGEITANQASIFVPMMDGHTYPRAGYLPPKQWLALVDKTGFWTIQVGDYVVKGEVTDEVPSSITMSSLIAKYDDVLKVASVDRMDSGSIALRHWEIGAR